MSSERSPAALAALEPEYWILGEIGRGGTAIVYLARDRATGEEVAIKLIRPKYLEDDEAIARFAREARFVTQLNHPNVVGMHRVLDLGTSGIALAGYGMEEDVRNSRAAGFAAHLTKPINLHALQRAIESAVSE